MNIDRTPEIKRLAQQIQPYITQCLGIIEKDNKKKIDASTFAKQNDLSKPIVQPIVKDIVNHWPDHIAFIGDLERILPPMKAIDAILFPPTKLANLVKGENVSRDNDVETETRFTIPEFRARLTKELNL